jgi:soluble lytic murein transglycosylase-like protein
VVVAPPPTLEQVRALRASDPVAYERGLRELALASDAKAAALLGVFLVDAKRGEEALPFLTQAADADPRVAPWLRLRIAEIHRAAGRNADAIAALTRILQDTPQSSAATTALLRLAALDPMQLPRVATIAIDELTEEDFVELAKNVDAANANAIRMRLLTQFPQGRFTEDTYDRLLAATPSPFDAMSADELIAIAQKLGSHDRYDREFDLLGRIAARFPDAAKSPAFRNAKLRAQFNSRRYAELLSDPTPFTDPPQILTKARAAWRNNQPQIFLAGLRRIEREFPASNEATEAKLLRAKYYATDEVNLDESIKNLEAAIAANALGNDGENLWTLGWTYLLAKRDDDALRVFADYEKRYPDGDYLSNSLFWTGKIEDRRGRREQRDVAWRQLQSTYPYSYFSYRARLLMGEPAVAPSEVPNGNVFPDVEAQIAAANDPRVDSVRELASLGLFRDATREMKVLAASNPDNLGLQFMLADLYVQGGEPFRANNVLQRRFRQFVRHGGSGVPHRFWEILFPLNYYDVIRAEAEKRQLDPFLVASIIRQETGFEPSTVSNAGAVGIMQIMPQEATAIATAAGLTPPTREQLFDPNVNIAIGAAELAQKIALMRGNVILGIAAYNGGEDAVGRWLAQTPIDDEDLFVESIPYAETRLYVKTVSRNRFEYRRIYEALAK